MILLAVSFLIDLQNRQITFFWLRTMTDWNDLPPQLVKNRFSTNIFKLVINFSRYSHSVLDCALNIHVPYLFAKKPSAFAPN